MPLSFVLVTTNGLTRTAAVENADVSPRAGSVESGGVPVTLATAVIVEPAGSDGDAVKLRVTVPFAGCVLMAWLPSSV